VVFNFILNYAIVFSLNLGGMAYDLVGKTIFLPSNLGTMVRDLQL
jgi:hypothetical protein